MNTDTDTDVSAFQRMAQHIDPQATLLAVAALHGGVSAQVQVFTLQQADGDGSTQRVVVRRHGVIDRTQNPQIARDEFRLLSLLHAQGLPVAEPLAVDAIGDTAPDGIPWIAVAFVAGSVDLAEADLPSAVPQMAAALASIHRIPANGDADGDGDAGDALAFLPQKGAVHAAPERLPGYALDTTMQEQEIREALAAAAQRSLPANPPTLLHGDYWPGNLLWHAGRLAAVLDWEDACTGDPLADVATARLELCVHHGEAWADLFTTAYRAAATVLDWTALPWWELRAALRMCGRITEWGLAADEEAHIRSQHGAFVQRALAASEAAPPSTD